MFLPPKFILSLVPVTIVHLLVFSLLGSRATNLERGGDSGIASNSTRVKSILANEDSSSPDGEVLQVPEKRSTMDEYLDAAEGIDASLFPEKSFPISTNPQTYSPTDPSMVSQDSAISSDPSDTVDNSITHPEYSPPSGSEIPASPFKDSAIQKRTFRPVSL